MNENIDPAAPAAPRRFEDVFELTKVFDDAELEDVLGGFQERIDLDSLPSQAPFANETSHQDDFLQPQWSSIDTQDRQEATQPSSRTNDSGWARDNGPGFVFISGEIDGTGYNETSVDVIAVPCPGADPIKTWGRDPLPESFFGHSFDTHEPPTPLTLENLVGATILSPGMASKFSRTVTQTWISQGIRRYASTARVLLYRHRELVEGSHLEELARDLLETLLSLREATGVHASRPLFFIAHSVGGLVVKKALVMANSIDKYRHMILHHCHGISFFAVPHRGSSYLSMDNLGESIKALLRLDRLLPRSLSSSLCLNSKDLLRMHEVFIAIASDMRIWTFYETIDSRLFDVGMGITDQGQFTAPLVSAKSALVNVHQETIYSSLESDHAHCASFGVANARTLDTYLTDLAGAIEKARELGQTRDYPLRLKDQVKVELVGFYDDPHASVLESRMRLYPARYRLAEFLEKGPEICFEERLVRNVFQPKSQGRFKSRIQRLSRSQHQTQVPVLSESETLSSSPLGNRRGSRLSNRGTPSRVLDPTDFEFPQKEKQKEGPSRPKHNQRRLMWIHVPFTNPPWVKDIFDKLSETYTQDLGRLLDHENWLSKHVGGRHSRSQPSFVKPAVNFSPQVAAPWPSHLSLFLPYLHFDTYRHIIHRRRLIAARLEHGRARPVPRKVAAIDSLELRTIWEYLGHDSPLHCRRTLDQYGYPSLRDTFARDDEQMLYKLTKYDLSPAQPTGHAVEKWLKAYTLPLTRMLEEETENDKDEDSEQLCDGNLLMVDQLWLWAINTTTLTTFFPQRESRQSEGALFQQADLRNSIYNELNGDLAGRCENALDLAAFVALHAVTVLLDRSSHPDLEVFRIFEEAISMLTERMTAKLKSFRRQTVHDASDSGSEVLIYNTKASIKERYENETQRADRESRENTSAQLELRDMEDELKTLQRLFDTQSRVIDKMHKIYLGPDLVQITSLGQGYLREALDRLGEYEVRTVDILERVAATRGDYEKLHEMSQHQAEVNFVRLQTELASSQNLSVLIFTVFTVIFMPLSFFTSLFGMNTLEWGGAGYPSLAFIGKISLPISAVMILATLVAALSLRVQMLGKTLFKRALNGPGMVAEFAGFRWQTEALQREKEEQREGERRTYDFWDKLRRKRVGL